MPLINVFFVRLGIYDYYFFPGLGDRGGTENDE